MFTKPEKHTLSEPKNEGVYSISSIDTREAFTASKKATATQVCR
jgi:hypothetical protein